ncbi:GxxExxY protein [Chryseobacterium sp. SIMBA_028]|uniref:GxxExxY protein n=1 Tax=Chryseobacterium sp. SIMBA_028 TaxID=3085771 RepID=UPI00397C222B
MTENELLKIVFETGLKIHKKLGAGVFEYVYEELRIENAFRLDIMLENKLISEIKIADYIAPTHKAQFLTYLKMGVQGL